MHTVELLPDAALGRSVRVVWERLAQAGLPSLAAHPHPTNRPHLTLAVAPDPPDGRLAGVPGTLPVPVRLAGVLAFGGPRGGLAWAVVPNAALLALHAAVADALGEVPDRYAPGRWTPHVSLALRATPAQRAAAVALLHDLPDTHGALVAARSYDTGRRTVTDLGGQALP